MSALVITVSGFVCPIHIEKDNRMQKNTVTLTISRGACEEMLSWLPEDPKLSAEQQELYDAMKTALAFDATGFRE